MSKQPNLPSTEVNKTPAYHLDGVSVILGKEKRKISLVKDLSTGEVRLKIESLPLSGNPTYFDLDELFSDSRSLNSIAGKEYPLKPIEIKGIAALIKDFIEIARDKEMYLLEHSQFGKLKNVGMLSYDHVYFSTGIKAQSKYTGILADKLELNGSLENALEGYRKYFATNSGFAVAVIAGLSGAIIPMLADEEVGNIVISLSGETSSGKTTAADAATAAFGRGFIASAESTRAGYRNQSEQYGIIPRVIEDLTMNTHIKPSEYAQIVMDAYEPDPRVTGLNSALSASYAPTIFTTEKPLLESIRAVCKTNAGYLGRMLEIDADKFPLTASVTQAEEIKYFLNQNHGYVAKEFIDHLYGNGGINDVRNRYSYWLFTIRNKQAISTKLMGRLGQQLAGLLVTGEKFNEAFGKIFDIEKLSDFLLMCAQEQLDRYMPQKSRSAWEIVQDFVTVNDFALSKKEYVNCKHKGFFDKGFVFIRRDVFDANFDSCRDELKQREQLMRGSDKSRDQVGKQFNGIRHEFYMLKWKGQK